MTFSDIRNYVYKKGFGISAYVSNVILSNGVKCVRNVFISNGVKYALENKVITYEQVDKVLASFNNGDFGIAYCYDEIPIKGYEYGQYETDLTPESEEGFLWIHREFENIVVYFHFER